MAHDIQPGQIICFGWRNGDHMKWRFTETAGTCEHTCDFKFAKRQHLSSACEKKQKKTVTVRERECVTVCVF